jgi:hypothetical protein
MVLLLGPLVTPVVTEFPWSGSSVYSGQSVVKENRGGGDGFL